MSWTKEERLENGIADLPATLAEALELLKSNEVMVNALGDHLFEHFIESKEIEWDMFRTQMHHENMISICLSINKENPWSHWLQGVFVVLKYENRSIKVMTWKVKENRQIKVSE
ncbi:hypothetical protein ACEQPO_14480 [Bacillus sp. SL00103]